MVRREHSDADAAIRALREAGYPLVERERRGPGNSRIRSDIVAWGGDELGEFRPQVSVEVKSTAGAVDPAKALAQLSASAATFGTAVNLVYGDGQWFQADGGFLKVEPIKAPPAPFSFSGTVTDPDALRKLLEVRLWELANVVRGRPTGRPDDVLGMLLDDLKVLPGGVVEGFAGQVHAPAALFVWAWMEIANNWRRPSTYEVTAPEVSAVMGRIAATRPGETVLDPFAGFGGTLLAALLQDPQVQSFSHAYGYELNGYSARIGQRLVEVLGVTGGYANVDSCSQPWEPTDVLVSVPPFGLRRDESMSTPFGPCRDAEVASIAWAGEALRPSGRAVLLTTRGWTFRSGPAASLRAWLTANVHVTALIGLPAVDRQTSIPLLLVVIDKAPPAPTVVADLNNDWQEQLQPGSELSRLLERPEA